MDMRFSNSSTTPSLRRRYTPLCEWVRCFVASSSLLFLVVVIVVCLKPKLLDDKILDSKKNVSNPSYVAEPFMSGDSLHAVLDGVIVPEEAAIEALTKSLNILETPQELCADSKDTVTTV
ncbi:hypothetical protein SDRG_09065 [Saprolegnia diclina VS20]|uniref:Uncharacterized protein n=1 Tax=Saprolegnia diclina (strain VS20) TaxID=1156394 RepID=T0Q6T8_SAPDV|nr:hypothetical protein SDRG_09065 [Saprolegnia diclina VS20]EQC33559.1 hypothetical protein SDRG_09065 [Saprolegnia diclina VS20]|eukprot:XP_008613199.1 hypothetical protein SDRG_09065 [Saprolegnia diclina VS20]